MVGESPALNTQGQIFKQWCVQMSSIQNEGISTFSPLGILSLRELAHCALWGIFRLEGIGTFCTISILYVLNCFKYFLTYTLEQNVSKSDKKDFELYQFFMC